MYSAYCGKGVARFRPFQALTPFKILFDEMGNPIGIPIIKSQVSDFPESYFRVVKTIISKSASLNSRPKDMFKFNVATLMSPFNMTRRGAFHGVKTFRNSIIDPNGVLDACWTEAKSELQDLRKHVDVNSSNRSRAIPELPPDSRDYVIEKTSELFDKLEWTTIEGSKVGRVAASKILFAVLPEIALPVDNSEWDFVFRTHSYGRVLTTMVDEINEWEKKSKTKLETLDSHPLTTLPSIYNIMAMAARLKKQKRE